MCQLNKPGADFAHIPGVTAMTDVTGFGLLGHLSEICQGSGVQAILHYSAIPRLPAVEDYIAEGCVPGGTGRNFDSYGHLIGNMSDLQNNYFVILKPLADYCWRSYLMLKPMYRPLPLSTE